MKPKEPSARVLVQAGLSCSAARIWKTVLRIPPGRVASYGQVARQAGLAGRARLVGQVLRRLPPGLELPWHRVVNAAGRISLPGLAGSRQVALLEREGVTFVSRRIDMSRYGWSPRARRQPPSENA